MADGAPDDYYVLLGIAANATHAELRRAWRRLALKWHPDRAGAGATATFQELLAAYTVLSDPVARRAYDRRRGVSTSRAGDARPAAVPAGGARRSAPAVMLWRLSGPLNVLLASGVAERAADDVIELFLTGREATEGGMATISMRVPVRCTACTADAPPSCVRCGGTRGVEELFSAWLAVPPGVAEGTVLAPSALLEGMLRTVSFRVRLNDADSLD